MNPWTPEDYAAAVAGLVGLIFLILLAGGVYLGVTS